ncbi:hypothetical protein K458DRAFT_29283 [Lentithecium fluviatile CBS 122367]|uniref:Eisosome protein 1 n=1 Tax=Lentithecium fluviatile CBS 122367 TaxID=1168545 RepID=A0A6G1J383_9PLEO|nr:hypothetical protein K458DRAFT_29283 [Lentithecium fluviatile CBS 122367]
MATQTHTAPNDAGTRELNDGAGTTTNGASMRCPDPSAHRTKDSTLQDQASAAALYSTNPTKAAPRNPLGADGKLSSATTSLKHAQAHDLPGFPVVGIDTRTSAGTAAHLASTNTKSPEWWKPEHSAAAGKAALLANDYKMKPLWQPEASAAGSKAALLAHKDGVKMNLWTPEASAYGNSAATIAMGKKGLGPQVNYDNVEDGHRKALVAATGAVASSGRRRAQSTPSSPPLYPDAGNSARNALSAATIASSPSMRKAKATPTPTDSNRMGSDAMEAARIQHAKTSREMYTDRPPVAIEVEEKKHQDALKASAISMAKKIYDVQQQHIDHAAGRGQRSHAQTGATAAHGQQPHASEADIKQQAMQYIGIQEAAQKLAAERLAKIEPDENAQYRSYYGYDKPNRNKLSMRRGRNRATSNPETADSDDDELTTRRIRSQMSQLNRSIAEVDAKKREQDRKHLLAAAERKVQAQMLGLDKKIFDETGKMSPAMIDEWDAKARAKAAANSEARLENHGRVHIGHGKYMDQSEIDAVALARVQPTLNDITEKTEKRRAEEEERRLELEEKKREAQIEKERTAEIKTEEKRGKDEERRAQKAREAEEKAAAKQEKEARKEKEAEEKRLAKEEKRKSREAPKAAVVDTIGASTDATATTNNDDLTAATGSPQTTEKATPPTSPTSPKSESKGLKSLLNKFKRRSKHSSASAETDKPGFIGGVALRNSESQSQSQSRQGSAPTSPPANPTHIPAPRDSEASSVSSNDDRGRTPERTISAVTAPERTATGLSEVSQVSRMTPERTMTGQSGVSEYSDVSEYEEARDDFNEALAPPPNFTSTDASAARKGSPTRDSKFREVGI